MIHPPGVACLRRWGLADRLAATGCPPIGRYGFDFGPRTLAGSPGTADFPRRLRAPAHRSGQVADGCRGRGGAEVREAFTVAEILTRDGKITGVRRRDAAGAAVVEHARVVVGADGRNSVVAKAVRAEQYHERPPLTCGYYLYRSDLPIDGTFEIYSRPGRGIAACPTHDGLTMVVGGWPYTELAAHRNDIEATLLETFAMAPAFAERVRDARRAERFVVASVPNYFRRPYGPGWALVGDAGYNRDFITAQGITDAFRDAELCADALDRALTGTVPYDEAMAGYHSARDERRCRCTR